MCYLLSFTYQEWWVQWTMWGFGWDLEIHGGWEYDALTIFLGPLRFVLLSGYHMPSKGE
jgi:hypothetical protein